MSGSTELYVNFYSTVQCEQFCSTVRAVKNTSCTFYAALPSCKIQYTSTVLYVHSYPAQFYIPTYNAALTALQYFLNGSTVLHDTVLYDQFYSTIFFMILLHTMYPS